ncbi:CaiB/BaiF CoA transferase family protein [Bradyrhizobium erythrophlei]|uniref:CaiB/BaiF CoA transferase family protein n=1 Tax=Bradyrhizobium erythrophlei TaxID=1437360 RepID=UPI0035EAC003
MRVSEGPAAGLKVIDAATLFAGPMAATLLGDYGANVLKIEHPKGDGSRTHGPSRDGTPLWWKVVGRNKRAITLYLGSPDGQRLFRRLARDADVVIENFRPGTLEKWGLSYEQLAAENPGLILLRVTAFGQRGPYSPRPGFGTIAEAMSGFASITGHPEGPPTLPPFGLADGISGIAGALAVMMAVNARHRTGRGQVIDLALIEPIMAVLGAQAITYDQLGRVQKRTGNRSDKNAPRNTYKTADGKWVAVSTSSTSIAARVMRLVGLPEVVNEPWFQSASGRLQHVESLDSKVAEWIGARPMKEVVLAFEEAEAALAPVYDISDIFEDPQYRALETITTVHDPELGPVRMQNVIFRMSETPGAVRWSGRPLGADNEQVFKEELGLSDAQIAAMKEAGAI